MPQIVIDLPNPMPAIGDGMATQLTVGVIDRQVGESPLDSTICGIECCDTILALADLSNPNIDCNNDEKDFLFRPGLPTGPDEDIKLFRCGQDENDPPLAILDAVSPFGTFFPQGTFTNSADQMTYFGFLLDWNQVLLAFGPGDYIVRVDVVIPVLTFTVSSPVFSLRPYSPQAANGTVRLDAIQNGCIESNRFDYTGMNWFQSVRIPGIFWQRKPLVETDEYLNLAREINQIQDQIKYTTDLQTYFIGSGLHDVITENYILANLLTICDFNICNPRKYTKFEVRIDSIPESEELGLQKKFARVYRFKDRTENIVKRNFN